MGDRLGIPCVLSIFFIFIWGYGPHRIRLWHFRTTRGPPSGQKMIDRSQIRRRENGFQGDPRAKIHLNSLEWRKLKLYSSHF